MAFYRGCGIVRSGFSTIHEGDTASIEFKDPEGKYVADVARRNGNSLKYIFEIRHSLFLMGTAALYRVCSTGLR